MGAPQTRKHALLIEGAGSAVDYEPVGAEIVGEIPSSQIIYADVAPGVLPEPAR